MKMEAAEAGKLRRKGSLNSLERAKERFTSVNRAKERWARWTGRARHRTVADTLI